LTKFSEVRECRELFTWIIGPTDVVWGMWQRRRTRRRRERGELRKRWSSMRETFEHFVLGLSLGGNG
jgi:hypothetical protein